MFLYVPEKNKNQTKSSKKHRFSKDTVWFFRHKHILSARLSVTFHNISKAGRPLLRITAKNHSRSILLASLSFILSKHSFYPLRQPPRPFLPAAAPLRHPSHFRSPPLFIRKDSSVRLCFLQVRGTDVYGRKSSFLRKRISVHKLA